MQTTEIILLNKFLVIKVPGKVGGKGAYDVAMAMMQGMCANGMIPPGGEAAE